MTQPDDTAISAYARVHSATSDVPVTAKSIATATGLPYKQVTEELAKLENLGYVAQSKDGSRTVWARADNPPADVERVPTLSPRGEGESTTHDVGSAIADAVAADTEATPLTLADVLAKLDNQKIETLKRPALVALCADLAVPTNPRDTKAQLAAAANRRIADLKQAERDAARPDYAGMNVKSLREAAKGLGVAGTVSKMARADLLAACGARYDELQDAGPYVPSAETRAAGAESDAAAPVVPDGPWGSGNAGDAPSGSVSAVLADLQAARPVSAPPAVSASPRRTSNRPAGGVVSSGTAPAWTRGQCEATLLAMLQAEPDADHNATSLVKRYNETRTEGTPVMQPGSTAFALDAMVKKGTARLTQEKPKRYAAAVVPIPSA